MDSLPTANVGGEQDAHDDGGIKKSPSPPVQDAPPDAGDKKTGRRKINIEFIEDKSRRHITFSKRKAGIMKKAYELSTLTGTQVLLLVASETGHVYTFATPKLQPLITKAEGKNLIQTCLNAPDTPSSIQAAPVAPSSAPRLSAASAQDTSGLDMYGNPDSVYDDEKHKQEAKYGNPSGLDMGFGGGGSGAFGYPQYPMAVGVQQMRQYAQMPQAAQMYGGSNPSAYAQGPYTPAAYAAMGWPGAAQLQQAGAQAGKSASAMSGGASTMQPLPLNLPSAQNSPGQSPLSMQKPM